MPRPRGTDYNPARVHEERVRDVAKVIRDHRRLISMDPKYPHACECGWTGTGIGHRTIEGHQARQVIAFLKDTDETAHDAPASIETVRLHRAEGEDLCKACRAFLKRLK